MSTAALTEELLNMQQAGLSAWHLLSSGCHHSQNARPERNAWKRNREKSYACIFTLVLVVVFDWLQSPWFQQSSFPLRSWYRAVLGFRMGTILSYPQLTEFVKWADDFAR